MGFVMDTVLIWTGFMEYQTKETIIITGNKI